jgi:hypothetical protein
MMSRELREIRIHGYEMIEKRANAFFAMLQVVQFISQKNGIGRKWW